MADFFGKVETLVPQVSPAMADTGPAHPFENLRMMNGTELFVPDFQVPRKNPYRNMNLWRYVAAGQYGNILSTGGQVQVPIVRGSGSGHVEQVWLRIQVKNDTAGAIQMQPCPLWLQNHNHQTPAGATIQTQMGTQLYGNIASVYTLEEYTLLSKAMGMDLGYQSGEPIGAGVTRTYYIPLIGHYLEASGFFLPATSGDLQCYFNFWPDNNIRNTGSGALTVQQISLDIKMEQLAPVLLERTKILYKSMRHDYIIPYYKSQNFQTQMTTGQTTQLNLSSISGDVIYSDFCIRPSYVKDDLTNFQVIDSYQYQNQEGIGISGQQYIDDVFNRKILWQMQNDGTLPRFRKYYRHVFANNDHSPKNILLYGLKLGAYPFDNHNNCNIVGAAAGVNEIWSLTTNVFGATPWGGTAVFRWTTPNGDTYQSSQVTYADLDTNGSPLTKAAIEAMPNFAGTVTIAGRISLNTLTITFGGNYGNRALANEGYVLTCDSALFATVPTIAGAPGNQMGIPLIAVLNTSGSDGITSGSTFFFDFYVVTTGYVSLLTDGNVKCYNS